MRSFRDCQTIFAMVGLLSVLGTSSGCGQEPTILVNLKGWKGGENRIRIRPSVNGDNDDDFFLSPTQTQFAYRVPEDRSGTVHFDATALNYGDCKVSVGGLTVTIPHNLNHFVETALELSALSSPACILGAATNFRVNAGPREVAVGDLDGDTRLDIAIGSDSDTTVSILTGDGTGAFNRAPDITIGPRTAGVMINDFDRDSRLDLVVSLYGDTKVSVLLGKDKFDPTKIKPYIVGTNPYSSAAGDFNGDGYLDLAVANGRSNDISILLNDKAGGFGVATNYPVGQYPYSIAVGDFNGDGKRDLAVANGADASRYISVLFGDGKGSFGSTTNLLVGLAPYCVVVGDFNRDSNQDFAIANYRESFISVMLGDGAGSFKPATNFSVGKNPIYLAANDFNNDGKLDLVVANYGSSNMSLLLGKGDGSFGPPTNFPVGNVPIALAVGDFNGDKMPDVVVSNYGSNNVTILLNQFD